MPKDKKIVKAPEPVVVATPAPEPVKEKKPKADKKAKVADEDKPEKKHRSFRAIYKKPTGDIQKGGRFSGNKPKQAASKALSGIMKEFKKSQKVVKGVIYFGIQECTRGGKHKIYWYSGERKTIDNPVSIDIKDDKGNVKKITYKFTNRVMKAFETDCGDLPTAECLKKHTTEDDVEEVKDEKPKKVRKSKKTKKVEEVVVAPPAPIVAPVVPEPPKDEKKKKVKK